MFFCEPCRSKNAWPEGPEDVRATCEICGEFAYCHDIPDKNLPPRQDIITPDGLLLSLERAKARGRLPHQIAGDCLAEISKRPEEERDLIKSYFRRHAGLRKWLKELGDLTPSGDAEPLKIPTLNELFGDKPKPPDFLEISNSAVNGTDGVSTIKLSMELESDALVAQMASAGHMFGRMIAEGFNKELGKIKVEAETHGIFSNIQQGDAVMASVNGALTNIPYDSIRGVTLPEPLPESEDPPPTDTMLQHYLIEEGSSKGLKDMLFISTPHSEPGPFQKLWENSVNIVVDKARPAEHVDLKFDFGGYKGPFNVAQPKSPMEGFEQALEQLSRAAGFKLTASDIKAMPEVALQALMRKAGLK